MPVENLVATEIESVSDDETSALTVNELVYELVSNNKNGLDILIDGFVMSKLRDNKNSTNYKCRHKTGREACPGSVTVDRGSGKVLRYVEHERHDRLTQAKLMVRGFKKSIKEEVVKNPTQPIQQVFQKMQMDLVESKLCIMMVLIFVYDCY